MANHATHFKLGIVSGATCAAYLARERQGIALIAEAIGGAAGGAIGAQLPDIFDPPTNPNHRSVAHAILPNAVAFNALSKRIGQTQEFLRSLSDEEVEKSAAADNEVDRFFLPGKGFRLCIVVRSGCWNTGRVFVSSGDRRNDTPRTSVGWLETSAWWLFRVRHPPHCE